VRRKSPDKHPRKRKATFRYGKPRKFNELSEIDVWMASFSWTVSQAAPKLTQSQKRVMTTLLNDYRLYIQGGQRQTPQMYKKIETFISWTTGTQVKKPTGVIPSVRPAVAVTFAMMNARHGEKDQLNLARQDKELILLSKIPSQEPTLNKNDVTLNKYQKQKVKQEVRQKYQAMPPGKEKNQVREQLFKDGPHLTFKSGAAEKLIARMEQSEAMFANQFDIYTEKII